MSFSIIILAFEQTIFTNEFLNFSSFILVIILNTYLYIQAINQKNENTFAWDRFKSYTSVFSYILRPLSLIFKIKIKDFELENKKKIIKVIIGILISVPILIFILIFLKNADPIFDNITKDLILNLDLKFFKKPIIFTVVFIYFLCIFKFFQKYTHLNKEMQSKNIKEDEIIFTILFLVNILYLAFILVQVKYLVFNYKLPDGITYSSYARDGFFQLVFLSVFNLLISFISQNSINIKKTYMKLIVIATNISTLFLIYSAFFRMKLYQDAYGLTRLRVLVYLFLIFEIFILLYNILSIEEKIKVKRYIKNKNINLYKKDFFEIKYYDFNFKEVVKNLK